MSEGQHVQAIQCVVAQPQPQTIYVDQNDNPLPVQQQTIYVDQNGNPVAPPVTAVQQRTIYVDQNGNEGNPISAPVSPLNVVSAPQAVLAAPGTTSTTTYTCNCGNCDCSKRTKIIIGVLLILILVGAFLLFYFFLINPVSKSTPSPTPKPTTSSPTRAPTGGWLGSTSCFSSDSYAFIFPDFNKKHIEDLQIYDEILSYDELQDEFVWDELLFKFHFEQDEHLNNVTIPMIEFVLNNGERLSMTNKHLLYVYKNENENGLQSYALHRADQVNVGDKLKNFNGMNGSFPSVVSVVSVVGINNVTKYARNMLTYNGNLVINGIAISFWSETLWGESKLWGKIMRFIMKYIYSYNVWRYPFYYFAKVWTDYTPFHVKQAVLTFYFTDYQSCCVFCFALISSLCM